MKLWDKGYKIDSRILEFSTGNDPIIDLQLLPFDIEASIAHAKMLKKIKVLKSLELKKLLKGLNEIKRLNKQGKFSIRPEEEDCHTAIENYLTKNFGVIGKKIHTGRSRNDQVLAALRLYEKEKIKETKKEILVFNAALKKLAKKFGKTPLPGYTHMRKAMPTTVKDWLECYAQSSQDNVFLLDCTLELIDKSPLGTGAGFGVPVFKLDRKMTARLMKFSKVLDNPIYAQLTRGKFESSIIHALSQVMFDLNKLSSDIILFSMGEFGFLDLPKEICTGSSMMPQKKNPDVLELVRGKYHIVIGEEFKIKSMLANLIAGFHREMQLTKEPVIASFDATINSLKIMSLVVSKLRVDKEKCKRAMSPELYATERAYKLVKEGIPFREAYKKVGKEYAKSQSSIHDKYLIDQHS